MLEYQSQILQRPKAVRELILCHQVSLELQADQACCIISSGIAELVFYSDSCSVTFLSFHVVIQSSFHIIIMSTASPQQHP